MKKEELLQFVPNAPEKGWGGDSTNKISKKAKLNYLDCKNLLYELRYLPMPLVECMDFKTKNRVVRYWRRTKPNEELIKQYLKIPLKDRSTKEHDYLIKFKYYGDLRKYISEALNENRN